MAFRVIFLAAIVAVATLAKADPSVVMTTKGAVKGIVSDIAREFRGIPYAAPPVNELRWKDPQDHKSWAPGTLSATVDGPGCPQSCYLPPHTCPARYSEDCLYLNVFTPLPSQMATSGPLPVLMWIHGGNFKQGSGTGLLYDGSHIAKTQNVIVVTINYRLGALGFLNNNQSFTGNYGIKDQRFAMQWIQQNIASFGGDPTRVTLFGQSAGAMSIATHMISPKSKNLFHRAILESEPFGLPFRTTSEFEGLASAFADKANCTSGDVETCLRNLPYEKIIEAQVAAEHDIFVDIFHLLELFLPWTPTAGSEDCPEQPIVAFVSGKHPTAYI